MTIATEMIFMFLEKYLNSFYTEDDGSEEETATLEFEDENAFLDFEVRFNEMIINLAEFDNFGGGAFVSTIRGDFATLTLYFYEDEGVTVCTKSFIISY